MIDINRMIDILVAMKHRGVVIYGVGKRGEMIYEILRSKGFSINAIADKKVGKKLEEMSALSLEMFCERSNNEVCIVTPNEDMERENKILNDSYEFVINFAQIEYLFMRLSYFIPKKETEMNYAQAHPFNHYESPFASIRELYTNERMVSKDDLMGIDLNINEQITVLKRIIQDKDSFESNRGRYAVGNGMFDYVDALTLHSIICQYRPKTIIEIGSGYSTAVMLDTNEYCMKDQMDIISIEPYPERLLSILREDDSEKFTLKKEFVQNVELEEFQCLEENDILFIDSSHVAKIGGDIQYEYFHILPHLKKGVIIHIHDIFYPFTYPETWIRAGRPYNEAFVLRGMLMDSEAYRILFFSDMLRQKFCKDYEYVFRGADLVSGSSIWLKKEN